MQIQGPRASLLLLLTVAVSGASGCAPRASATPLGLGPLALAEHDATAAEHKPRAARHHAPAREASASAATNPSSHHSREASDDNAAAETEKPSERAASEPKSGKAAPAFAGLFAGKDVAIFRIEGMQERQELDDKAQIRIASESPSALRIALINSENGSDLCTLSAEIQGNSATLDSGQPCFSSEGEGAIHAELTSGTLVLNGDRLSMDAEGTLSVALDEEELDGELSYSFKGKRE